MVATERIKAAEADEELRSTIEEKEALKSALKLIERENDRLRQSILERADPPSSEDKTERTLLSITSLEGQSHNDSINNSLEPQDNSQTSLSEEVSEEDIHTPKQHAEQGEDEGSSIQGNTSVEMVTATTEAPSISKSVPSHPPSVSNPWSTTFLSKDFNQGLISSLG
jgi:chromatin segregation and condensation protein Rec8/ScpA/Scc1 (kleisin family)